MKLQKLSHQIKKYLMLTIIIIAGIILIATSLIILIGFNNEHTDFSNKQMNYIKDQLHTYRISIEQFSHILVGNNNIQQSMSLYYKQRPEHSKYIMTINTELKKITQPIPYIHSAAIYDKEKNLITGTARKPYALSQDSFDYPGAFVPSFKSSKNSDAPEPTFSYIYPFYDIQTGNLLGYMELAISEKSINAIYAKQSDEHSFFYICDKSGTIQSTSKPHQRGQKINGHIMNHFDYSGSFQSFFEYGNYICISYMPELDWFIINSTPISIFLNTFVIILSELSAITLIAIGFSIYFTGKVSDKATSPLKQLVNHIQEFKSGIWTPLDTQINTYEYQLLFKEFNQMVNDINIASRNLIQSQKQKDRIYLRLLQEQINPHFLYNTLDNIYSLAYLGENEKLMEIVIQLSNFYRLTLSHGEGKIKLGDELQISELYLSIMSIRYNDKFRYSISCDEALLAYPCPKLLLQPLTENAIYHGIKEIDKTGEINICVVDCDDDIEITVADNGVGISDDKIKEIFSESQTSFAVRNIHQRLQLYYGEGYGLSLRTEGRGGCTAVIRIKKEIQV